MAEYSNEWALEMQELAREGDEEACWALVNLVKPCMLVRCGTSTLERCLWDEVWSDCIRKLTAIAASGNAIERWYAYAKRCVSNLVVDHVKKECRRRRAEEMYMESVRVRYTEAYPAVRECVAQLDEDAHDLIQRMYFRPVRQNCAEIAYEMCANYYAVWRLHRRTLNALKGMLMCRGIDCA